MALKVADRIKENTSSTGVGGLSLTGAPAGFRRFSEVLSSGDTTFYTIEENDKFEVGIGTYGSNNLQRTTVLSSSNSGSKISLGGSGVVFITYTADKSVYNNQLQQSIVGSSGVKFADGTIQTTAASAAYDDTYVSGIATYASGQSIINQGDIVAVSGLIGNADFLPSSSGSKIDQNTEDIATASGALRSDITINTNVSSYASGQALSNQSQIVSVSGWADSTFLKIDDDTYVSGVANYASGQSVANQEGVVSVSGISAYASGQVLLNSSEVIAVSGWAESYVDSQDHNAIAVSGWADSTFLKIDDDTYVSGIASYASGQAVSNQSSISTNASNISTNTGNISSNTAKVNYASGQAIENESDIAALLTASGTATSLIASSGIANYASGQAVSNQANITTNASNITYVSGVATNKFTVTAADSSNYTIDGMGLNSATDPSIYLHKGHTYYFDKQTSGHPFRVSTSNGGSAYQDADGNNIEISGQGVLKFEVPQDAPDKLYYYCTSHAAMNGVIYTTNNVDEIIHVSGIADYASGQAITNQSNITALNTASGIATSLLAVSGTATSLVATSGIATYASGQAVSNQSNITALLTASGTATSLIASSGIASYASGQAVVNESDIVAVSGIAAYASGTSGAGGSITVKEVDGSPNVSNVTTIVVSNGTLTDDGGGQVTVTTGGAGGGGDVTTSELNYVSGIAVYSSGQAISNQSNITALNTASGIATSLLAVSGTATSLVATSGIATYASGNTANISFGSNAEGDLLYHNGTSFIRLPKGADDYILKMDGNVPNWEADSGGSSLSAGSGVLVDGASKINVYGGSGNFQELQVTSDNVFVPKVVFTGSGAVDTPITLETRSSYESVSGSGSALLFQGTQGQLFSITDNLSSGVIFSVADIAGLPLIEADASGDVKLAEFGRYVGVGSGIPEYGLDISASGRIQKGVVLSSYVPAVTTNTLYNEGGTLKFNGSAVGGGGGGVDAYTSGVATYASGQAISNQSSITALLSASGTATSLIASSGIASYASGQAVANESDILATSGIAHYASGLNNYLLNPSGVGGISITSDADFVIFSGDATLARSSELNYVSGVSVYASGRALSCLTAISEDGSPTLGGELNLDNNDIVIDCKNSTGSTITAGTPVYISGYFSANGKPLISPARADDPTKMPAIGFVESDISNNSEGTVGIFGVAKNINTDGFDVGDVIYVSGVGGITNVRPTGIIDKIQNIGRVVRSDASNGRILILGPGRSNDVPNSGEFKRLNVDGHFTATTKSFLIDHPTKDGMKLQYGSLEGPENGVYVRGTSGSNIITLPEYWSTLVDQSTVTVSLTPVGYYQALYVEEKGKNYIKVGGAKGSYDYVVYGERKDVEKLKVEW